MADSLEANQGGHADSSGQSTRTASPMNLFGASDTMPAADSPIFGVDNDLDDPDFFPMSNDDDDGDFFVNADDHDDDDDEEEEEDDGDDDDEEYEDEEGEDGGNNEDDEDQGFTQSEFDELELLGSRLVGGTQVIGLLRSFLRSGGRMAMQQGDDGSQYLPQRRLQKDPGRFPKVPSDAGIQLMRSGVFGANPLEQFSSPDLSKRIIDRELGIGSIIERKRNQDLITQALLPKSRAETIIHYDDPVYSGQFSDDGSFFFSCCQDMKVRMYDTSNPYSWKYYKTVVYPWGGWTLTDASLSLDNKWLAYSALTSQVCLVPTDPEDTGDPYYLDMSQPIAGRANTQNRSYRCGVFSVRFSSNGRELVAGTNAHSIIVYDIESRQVLHRVAGHSGDVNAVCFADKSSPHILYSGSDDSTIKVWDRRSMADRREAGAFVGHMDGITYIDSKGDGRYILSNGKDQTMKLWDLRMAMSTEKFASLDIDQRRTDFDYRTDVYNENDWDPDPNDNSVVTFRGHKVLRTLIRCHFSPPGSTNSRYVYSGSKDGKVYIWNMDATLAGTIDVRNATKGTRRPGSRYRYLSYANNNVWSTCVRDASWHPTAPVLVASAWNGYSMAEGTCTIHSYNDEDMDEAEPAMGRSVNEKLTPITY